MAVATLAAIRLWHLDQRGPHGAPAGIFSGTVRSVGDASAGNNVATVLVDNSIAKGRLFRLRYLQYSGPDVGGDDFLIQKGPDYFTPNFLMLWSGSTVDGFLGTGDYQETFEYWLPPVDVDSAHQLVRLTTLNINTEIWDLSVQGVYWELSTLRRQGVGPLLGAV